VQGLHLTADLRGCDPQSALMLDPAALGRLCREAVQSAGLGAVAELFHRFEVAPGCEQSGITGVLLLAESHLAIHTWPELGGVTLDVYVCNLVGDNSAAAERLMQLLCEAFSARERREQRLVRG
jgi:S-adenosylmethionine decarboxylase proenzyme